MEILAGYGFDGRPPNRVPRRLGQAVVGPEGLLRTLEFRAGLITSTQSRAERVVRYHNALKAADGPGRFYHRSLAADPLETARLLLEWRDYAIDHGWSPGPASPGRLGDLAAVETHAAGLAPCLGERVTALAPRTALIAAAIDRIALADARTFWPPSFRHLFDTLAAAGVDIVETCAPQSPGAPADSDLGRLQRALTAPPGTGGPCAYADDGSLRLYRCLEPHGCAAALCDSLAGLEGHLLVAGGDRFLLGAAARARGLANPGLGEPSAWRPPPQLLPLLFQVAWSPPTAEVLLQYLTLPAGRFQSLRRTLAGHFGDRPGYDHDHWQGKVEDFVQRRLAAEPDLKEDALRVQIADWLPISAAGSGERMPRHLAIDLADRVRHYWQSRRAVAVQQGAPEVPELAAAGQAAEAMAYALRDWPEEAIPREPLNRLIEIAALAGASVLGQTRQVSVLNGVDTPEAARLAADAPAHLVWWEPASGPAAAEPPFDQAELASLPDRPDADARQAETQARLHRALQPLIAATASATLVVQGDSGDLLRLSLDQWLPAGAWRPFEAALLAGHMADLNPRPLADLPLQPPQRWWRTDRLIPGPRERESYSSLAALALKPHQYVLKYAASLSEGSIVALPVDNRLLGTLGHRLIQEWFEAHPWTGRAPDQATVARWLDGRLTAAIAAYALPLAAPGRRVERLTFRDTLVAALFRLLGHLASAGVQEVLVESQLETTSGGQTLMGFLDLLGRLADGRWVIVDLKWGSERARAAELTEGRYLQLAVYAQLAASIDSAGIAEVVYFILQSATLLATSQRVFPDARVLEPNDPAVTPAVVWQRLQTTVNWRRGQLAEGLIEVTGGAVEPTDASQPPAGALPLIEMEAATQNDQGSGYRRPTFKPIDPWRVITGAIRP
jgi:hypothetical protein